MSQEPRHLAHVRRYQSTERLRATGERGAALIIALVFLVVFGLILAALLSYAGTSVTANRTYADLRAQRYDGNNAIQLAVATVRNQPRMGRDPILSVGDPKCVFHNPSQSATGTPVTVSCLADKGAGSGKPAQGGLVPDDAIVALGERHNESPPYNNSGCGILGLNSDADREVSIRFQTSQVRQGTDTSTFVCSNRNRPPSNFAIRGTVKAKGKVVVPYGSVSLVASPSAPGTMSSPFPCSGAISPPCATTTAAAVVDPGDPGDTGAVTAEAWKNVPIDYTVRTTAYTWNGSTLVAAPACSSGSTMIFLPGWYKDADVVNRYTASATCKEATFWFAPNPGGDGVPGTSDDVTGAYYFAFRNGGSTSCNGTASQAHRWCIGGGAADSSPRVVVGSAKGWNPLATTTSGPSTRTVTITNADTVDSGLSQSWSNAGGAKLIGDGSTATYTPTFCLFGTCFSTDRAIRVRDFQPKVAAAPDVVSGNPGNLDIVVSHREESSSPALGNPKIEIRAVGDESGTTKNCPGTYSVPANTSSALVSSLIETGSGDTHVRQVTAARAIGACLNSADLINGMQVTMKVTGNGNNSSNPKVFLDGVSASFTSTPRATFPLPATAGVADANLDCDPDGPGAQLIFGGDSHVYVADGSLEVCAGLYPNNPEDHQQIGLWQVPAVKPLRPTVVEAQPVTVGPATNVSNPNGAKRIAEPAGISATSFSRSASCDSSGITCVLGFGGGTHEAGVRLTFPQYTPPAGTAVDKVQVRAAYDSNGFLTGPQLEIDGCEGRTGFQASEVRVPFNGDLVSDSRDLTSCLASKITDAAGTTAVWYARATSICGFGACSGSISGDRLDGLEMVITLKPADENVGVLLPASGCTQAYPNYWAGAGSPDCAVIKADSVQTTPIISGIFPNEANWFGRFTIQGTIYAPSGAVEIDDSDAAYPAASRGLVVRHLRITGYRTRAGYSAPAVDTVISKSTNPREMTFSACIQSAARRAANEPCLAKDSSGNAVDQVITRARVRYEIDPATTGGTSQPLANVPRIQWWTVDR